MKRPMTTEEFFDKIHSILKERGSLPDILDYSLATHSLEEIRTYAFNLKSDLHYGGNEGIYLILYIEYEVDGEEKQFRVGTYKTLLRSDEAMHTMAELLANWIIEEYKYVNDHLDDFTWFGADVYPVDKSGKKCGYGVSCGSKESALKQKDKFLLRHSRVAVRDNVTREETIYVAD